MQKKIFILVSITALIGCSFFESNSEMSTQAITEAQEQSVVELYDRSGGDSSYEQYHIMLDDEIIVVMDPMNGNIIHSERWDSNSALAKAILKDNE